MPWKFDSVITDTFFPPLLTTVDCANEFGVNIHDFVRMMRARGVPALVGAARNQQHQYSNHWWDPTLVHLALARHQ